jgi:uncharacterized protein
MFKILLFSLIIFQFVGLASKNKSNNIPWDDGKLTCKELHQYKDIIFTQDLDLGSGHGSPIDVDYDCNGSISTLPFMKNILLLRDMVRQDGYIAPCFGSIVYAHTRYDSFRLLRAGLTPNLFLADMNRLTWIAPDGVGHDEQIRRIQKYFKLWGHQSIKNYELYNRYWDEYIKTLPKLTQYYQESFHVSREKATSYSTGVMQYIFIMSAGMFPSSLMDGHPDITPLEKVIIAAKTTPQQLKVELSKATVDELNQGLKTAILHNKPTEYLKTFLDAGAKIDSGHESALFFALKNPEITKFLLSKKANVNYTNSFGKTPLFYAIGYNDLAMVELLLSNGANVNQRYFSKEQLEKAEYQENTKIPFYLYGVSCSLTTTLRTPLLHAAQNADVAMMKMLIAHGASIKDTDENGDTLADYAERSNKKENIDFVQSLGVIKKVW